VRRDLVGEVGLVFRLDRRRGWLCVSQGGLLRVSLTIVEELLSMIIFVRQAVGRPIVEVEGC
jgi:hypothetical protein